LTALTASIENCNNALLNEMIIVVVTSRGYGKDN
jgi:hypothetical protein